MEELIILSLIIFLINQIFSSVSARVQKVVENLHHVGVFVEAKFCLQPFNDSLHTLAISLEAATEVLCHLPAEVGGLVEGMGEDQVCLDVVSCAGVGGEG